MLTFPMRGTTIIKLTVAYSLIVGLLGAYNWFTIFISTSRTAKPIGLFGLVFGLLLISVPYLVHALVLYRGWRGAWRFTILLYGFVFIVGMLSGLTTRFTNYTFSNLLNLILAGAIVSIFWTNIEVKAALGKFKNPTSPVDVKS